jgi:hypothetical protein
MGPVDLSHEALDFISGLQSGYSAKLFSVTVMVGAHPGIEPVVSTSPTLYGGRTRAFGSPEPAPNYHYFPWRER